MSESDHPLLFNPGPVEVRAALRATMSMPLIGHRAPRFLDEVRAVCDGLQPLFGTKDYALFENCPATALMEAGIRNLVAGRVLHLTCGAFSERWYKVSLACGRDAVQVSVPWGQANDVEGLRDALRRDGPFDAVAITHNETSTGVLNPLAELAAAVRECAPETLVLVDAVSSLGGAALQFDEWGLDLAFAGTQKCLALPPGLCVYAVSARAMERARQMPGRGFLLDFERAAAGLAAGRTVATPCVPLVFALRQQLDAIAAEGLEARWQRHLSMRDAVEAWADARGIEFFPDRDCRSPTVSALRLGGRDPAALAARATDAGFTLGKGYGKIKTETFRIGHMGDHTLPSLHALLTALD